MIFSIFRAQGSDFDVDSFLGSRRAETMLVWHKGESRRRGVYQDSGFSIDLAKIEAWPAALEMLEVFLTQNQVLLEDIQKHGVQSELSLGVTVGEDKSFAACLEFPTNFLARLVAFGIKLEIWAYPTNA